MTNFDNFMKDSFPLVGETEKDYFLRISAEYKDIQKKESRQLRKQRVINRLSSAAKLFSVDLNPNVARTQTQFFKNTH